jgi:alpha-L-fucosidase
MHQHLIFSLWILSWICAPLYAEDKPWFDFPRLAQDYDYQPLGLDNKPERVAWLQDAGFGMFIHFGVDSQLGSVISHSVCGASEDYLKRFYGELPKTFNPKRFDPEEIATLAKLAGMKYITFTAKHHSGFCMWDTKTTDFNIMNTPYGRDLLAEYVAAVRKVGLAVGIYYSPEDALFFRNHGAMFRREGPGIAPEKNKAYCELIQAQCRELMTNYGKIDVLFFDGFGAKVARDACWQLQPDVLVTRGALKTPEQHLPALAAAEAWEACVTMGNQWQYKPTNEDYKSGTRLIEILIETRAKGGSLLLNIGPRPDGTVVKEQEERLTEIALWHFVNHEAVHDVRPWIIANEDNLWFVKHKTDDTVFVFITGIPDWKRGDRKEFVLKSVLATPETQVDVLGQSSQWIEYRENDDPRCKWEQKEDGLHVSVVRAQRLYNNHKWPNPVTMKITQVKPALTPPVVETSENYTFAPTEVTLKGKVIDLGGVPAVKAGFQYREDPGFAEALYAKPWQTSELVEINQPGEYQVHLAGLKTNTRYQFRAMLVHPRLTVYGDQRGFRPRAAGAAAPTRPDRTIIKDE